MVTLNFGVVGVCCRLSLIIKSRGGGELSSKHAELLVFLWRRLVARERSAVGVQEVRLVEFQTTLSGAVIYLSNQNPVPISQGRRLCRRARIVSGL